MEVRLLDPAERELDEVVAYYDAKKSGLANEFVFDFRRTVDKIIRWPQAWPRAPRTRNARRCRLDRFPYRIIYQIIDDEIVVVAVAHSERRATYWRDRLL